MQLLSLSNQKSAILWGNNTLYEHLYWKKMLNPLSRYKRVVNSLCYKNIILCIGKFNILGRASDTFQMMVFAMELSIPLPVKMVEKPMNPKR